MYSEKELKFAHSAGLYIGAGVGFAWGVVTCLLIGYFYT